MVRVEHIRRLDALQISRQGLERAREMADRASERLSRAERLRQERLAELRREEQQREVRQDYVRDFVELSRAQHAVRANARVFQTSLAASAEVVNLGRRIDVRA